MLYALGCVIRMQTKIVNNRSVYKIGSLVGIFNSLNSTYRSWLLSNMVKDEKESDYMQSLECNFWYTRTVELSYKCHKECFTITVLQNMKYNRDN